jgi:hypothetical protein
MANNNAAAVMAQQQQEGEESPELATLAQLVSDINAQVGRVKSLHQSGQLTPELATEEFCETFLPLLQDVAERAYHTQRTNEDFMDAVDAAVWPDGPDGAPSAPGEEGEDAPGLWPEDAEIFKLLLTEYREVLAKLDAGVGATKERMELIDKALARIDELTLDVEDGEDAPEEPPN